MKLRAHYVLKHISVVINKLLRCDVVGELLYGVLHPFEHMGLDMLIEQSRAEAVSAL